MFEKQAFRLFGDLAKNLESYFPDLKEDLKKANLKISPQEYIATSLFITLLSFLVTLPFLALFFSIATASFLFSYLTSIVVAIIVPTLVFFIHMNYPKTIVQDREKKIDKVLPFSTLYMSAVLSSELPLHKAIKMYSGFSKHEEINKEIKKILEDTEFYGLDINTAIEKAIKRSPSRKWTEFLYGLLGTMRSGGNLYNFVRDKTGEYILDYKRKLSEFSRSMTIYIQIYLISIVLGTIFFTILTSLISALGGGTQNVLGLQAFMVFIFLPAISFLFIFLVKKAEPAWE